MTTKTINTEKFPQLNYRLSGQGNAIVLVHGFPLDSSIWEEVAAELSAQYLVIAPDLPGAGESTFAGADLTMEDMAEAMNLVLQEEGVDSAIVAGHSMGGYAALAFAELYPEKLHGLGLVHSAANEDSEEKKEQRRKSISLFEKGGKDAFIKQMIPTLFAEENREEFKQEIDELTDLALLTDSKSLIAFYNAMINRKDRTELLKRCQQPVLWIVGEKDSVIPYKNIMQQTSLANVNFVYTHGLCGHMGMVEIPGVLADDLLSFAEHCYGISG